MKVLGATETPDMSTSSLRSQGGRMRPPLHGFE